MKENKVVGSLLIISMIVIISIVCCNLESGIKPLPASEITEGVRAEFGIDKNINEQTIDEYLFRDDSVYIDVRMLKDPAKYENIDGDSYLSGFVKGFEVLPYPYIVNVTGLPEEVGDTYKGKTLFTYKDGKYSPNYEESMDILEYYFPKDKNILLMCGGGGYAGMMKNMLVELGWNESRIYNTGGYWMYNGNNKVEVKRVVDEEEIYDFWKVTYHDLDFKSLHEVK